MSDELEVLIEKRDGLGLITLNRPKAINALNHSMVKAMAKALEEWKSDDRRQGSRTHGRRRAWSVRRRRHRLDLP